MSEIGFIVKKLWRDRTNLEKLRGKERIKLQKRLAFLTSECDNIDLILKPGIYGKDGNLLPDPPRDEEFEAVVTKWMELKHGKR